MTAIIDAINGVIWGKLLIYLLLGAGLYFTIRTGLVQFRHFGHVFTVMRRSLLADKGGISSFGAFATGMAQRVGTGNIVGVGLALTVGGPGAVFWMWVVALVGMATSFVENTLAQLYKVRDVGGTFRGGPAYYMERGLNARWMGVLFSVLLVSSYGFVFNAVHANSMTDALHTGFGFNRWLSGAVIVAIAALVVFGGIRRIAHFAEAVVPLMAVAYLAVAFVVVARHLPELPAIIALIVRSAFGLEQAAAGGLGWAVSQAMMQGVRRGLFSNEAGMGSSPNAAATAEVRHPAAQGFVQMLGVFGDTIVICTATASIILFSGLYEPNGELTGVPLTQESLNLQVGAWGSPFVAIVLQFFSFTTIVANFYFGEINAVFVAGTRRVVLPFRLALLACVMVGSVAALETVWKMADLAMGLMALVNLVAILLLSPVAVKVMHDYTDQLRRGVEPVFDRKKFPEIDEKLERDVW
ncbi:MAG: sodium:alanine symporter family protein [Candidatus Latescibacterota bacterium]|nr:MAG: sodium:alanine symporter family protein [Candidatus Latescibacterota bacterium]